jgi:hypothetical protein
MTVDERLEFLLHSTGSLHATCQELHVQAELHERRWELMRRTLRAALEAALSDDEDKDELGPQ